ncbi:MAG: rhodanese-related sulfurtransferase [Legionella sp.]|nr:rhodanese-related sulfurtransferase [Legionella sp.]
MNSFVIVAFYKFISIADYEAMKEPLLIKLKEYAIKGTIILASEGINGSFCGSRESIEAMVNYIRTYPGLEDLVFRETYDDCNPFDKAKVKLRREIVTIGCEDISPEEETGEHVSPEDWNNLIAEPEVVIVDTRNEYEVKLGTFKGAINPSTDNFRDFPAYVQAELMDKKDKKIAMFCTGGIRCEKSTAYLKKLGFNNVYQLNGGILNYLETIPDERSKWEGSCFVFDERVALDSNLNSLPKGSIDTEWKNNNKKKQCL